MLTREEINRLVAIAREYYVNKKTQAEIAEEFDLSRPTISKLLQEAEDENIVQISIIDPLYRDSELANHLRDVLQLQNVIVVYGSRKNPGITQKNIAINAAWYFCKVIDDTIHKIGIGWGRTMFQVSLAVETAVRGDIQFIPLLGGVGQINPSFQVHQIIQRIADVCGGTWLQLHVPGIIENKEIRRDLLKSRDVQEVISNWENLDLALVGIGEAPPFKRNIIFESYVDDAEKTQLLEKKAVGDICMRFFDINGKIIDYLKQEIISIPLHILKNTPRVVAAAGGPRKARSIIGACRGGFITDLVVDEDTGNEILQILNK
ncbi:MAG: sugar-binding transcriptional regulator [Anaerolineaceae bacterium]|jgi:DNA-binding transcriptional regulator LsrR (DeoR family)|nr:MAG: sugar-binding transcriptional regulator [Anaerolineaceae bacterium]